MSCPESHVLTCLPDVDSALVLGKCRGKAGVCVQADYLELGLMFHEESVYHQTH